MAKTFTCNVLRELGYNASELNQTSVNKKFLGPLEFELGHVLQYIEDLGHRDLPWVEPRILKLLDRLEKLCQWPTRCPQRQQFNTFDRRRYPKLCGVLKNRDNAKRSMHLLAIEKGGLETRKSLLLCLRSFPKPIPERHLPQPLGLYETTNERNSEVYDDYQVHLQELHSILSTDGVCIQGDGQKHMILNLHLNSYTRNESVDGVNFRVFFLDHPHRREAEHACHWQDTQICVTREKTVRISNTLPSVNKKPIHEVLSKTIFCEKITNRNRTQLELSISKSKLLFQGPGTLSEGFVLNESSVSLEKILDQLSLQLRLHLAYFLAKAFWQLYDSNWMHGGWTKHSVHFMLSRRSEDSRGIFIKEPFLSTTLDGSHGVTQNDEEFRAHPLPKLLAFGILLLELELGLNIKNFRKPEHLCNGEVDVNTDHSVAQEIFSSSARWAEKETFPKFKDVIEWCLFPPKELKDRKNDSEEIRNIVRKDIVNALYKIYNDAWGDPETFDSREIKLSSPLSPPPCQSQNDTQRVDSGQYKHGMAKKLVTVNPISQLPCPTQRLGTPNYQSSHQPMLSPNVLTQSSLQDTTMSSAETMGSEDWFKEFDRLNHVLRAKPAERGERYRTVRVAILDTGVKSEFGRQIEKYKDFVTEDDMNPVDQEGHGTHAVQLIKKANNKADIYVGRVFRRRIADENTLSLMTEAVTYATHQWKVDIIVIPSGFQSESDDMIKAIEDARSLKVLIFAAASNYGNIAHISFPGRLYPNKKLFCMFSADGYSRALPNFNPSVSKAAGYGFAILGAGIKLHENGEDLSGTSFATMIGARLASRILDFSRQEVMRKNIRRVERLQTVEGMTEIFNIMVGTGIDNKYHCITPWNILRSAIPGDQSLQRSEQRLHVCESISRAMEGLYKL